MPACSQPPGMRLWNAFGPQGLPTFCLRAARCRSFFRPDTDKRLNKSQTTARRHQPGEARSNVARSKRCLQSRRTLIAWKGPGSGGAVIAAGFADALQPHCARNQHPVLRGCRRARSPRAQAGGAELEARCCGVTSPGRGAGHCLRCGDLTIALKLLCPRHPSVKPRWTHQPISKKDDR
jgi:hypothetical protein